MRVLVVTPFLPYAGVRHAGGKLVHHLVQHLAREHEVVLVSRASAEDAEHVPALRREVAGLELVRAPTPGRWRAASLARSVASYAALAARASRAVRSSRFDLCHVEFTEAGAFWAPPRAVPSLLTCVDVIAKPAERRRQEADGLGRAPARVRYEVARAAESFAVSRFGICLALSEADAEWARRLYPHGRFRVLHYPAGLDFAGLPRREVPGRILFAGALARRENVEGLLFFHRHVWPRVRERVASAQLWIAGAGLSGDVARALLRDPRVTVTGALPSLEEAYKAASVFVAPILTGGGVIVKVLDALAAGTAVVSTSRGNEGIGASHPEEIRVADSPEAFAREVADLLGDDRARAALAEAGRRLVERRFSHASWARELEEAHEAARAVAGGARAAAAGGSP